MLLAERPRSGFVRANLLMLRSAALHCLGPRWLNAGFHSPSEPLPLRVGVVVVASVAAALAIAPGYVPHVPVAIAAVAAVVAATVEAPGLAAPSHDRY